MSVALFFRACIFCLIFSLVLISALDVDLDCPDEVYAGEEFKCEVEVSDGEATYDLKVEIDKKRDSVLKIWDGEAWKSGYYYVVDFVRKSEDVRLVIEEEGKYDVVVKLRDGEYREEFDVGKLKVLVGKNEVGKNEEKIIKEDTNPQIAHVNADFNKGEEVIDLGGESEVVLLGSEVVEDEWDYVSKDGLFVDWLPYLLCLFLICLVGILLWDR